MQTCSKERSECWEHLERLGIVIVEGGLLFDIDNIPRLLIGKVEEGDLPALQTVCLLNRYLYYNRDTIPDYILTMLSQKGIDICVADPDLEKIMIVAGLTEQI